MQDPVDSSPAVLVKRYNVTKQKELELQLSRQQEVLQKYVIVLVATTGRCKNWWPAVQ